MIATILAVKEEGAVFLCAPSNYAADVLALALSATLNDSGIKCRIVRVLSRTKGRHFLDNGEYYRACIIFCIQSSNCFLPFN